MRGGTFFQPSFTRSSVVIHSAFSRYSPSFLPPSTNPSATPAKPNVSGHARARFFKTGEELEKKEMKASRSRSTAPRFLTFTRLGRGRSRLKRILQGSDADQRNILKGGHEGREENQGEAAVPFRGDGRFFAWILRAENSRLHFHLMSLTLPRGGHKTLYIYRRNLCSTESMPHL